MTRLDLINRKNFENRLYAVKTGTIQKKYGKNHMNKALLTFLCLSFIKESFGGGFCGKHQQETGVISDEVTSTANIRRNTPQATLMGMTNDQDEQEEDNQIPHVTNFSRVADQDVTEVLFSGQQNQEIQNIQERSDNEEYKEGDSQPRSQSRTGSTDTFSNQSIEDSGKQWKQYLETLDQLMREQQQNIDVLPQALIAVIGGEKAKEPYSTMGSSEKEQYCLFNIDFLGDVSIDISKPISSSVRQKFYGVVLENLPSHVIYRNGLINASNLIQKNGSIVSNNFIRFWNLELPHEVTNSTITESGFEQIGGGYYRMLNPSDPFNLLFWNDIAVNDELEVSARNPLSPSGSNARIRTLFEGDNTDLLYKIFGIENAGLSLKISITEIVDAQLWPKKTKELFIKMIF